jgi:hypothetical protein
MIILPAQIEGLTARKDKTIKVTFGTQELTPVDAAQVFQLNQKFCYIAIKEESFQQDELDNIDSILRLMIFFLGYFSKGRSNY